MAAKTLAVNGSTVASLESFIGDTLGIQSGGTIPVDAAASAEFRSPVERSLSRATAERSMISVFRSVR